MLNLIRQELEKSFNVVYDELNLPQRMPKILNHIDDEQIVTFNVDVLYSISLEVRISLLWKVVALATNTVDVPRL